MGTISGAARACWHVWKKEEKRHGVHMELENKINRQRKKWFKAQAHTLATLAVDPPFHPPLPPRVISPTPIDKLWFPLQLKFTSLNILKKWFKDNLEVVVRRTVKAVQFFHHRHCRWVSRVDACACTQSRHRHCNIARAPASNLSAEHTRESTWRQHRARTVMNRAEHPHASAAG